MKFSKVNGLIRKVLTGSDKTMPITESDSSSENIENFKKERSINTPSISSIRSFRMKPKSRKNESASSGMEIESISSFSDTSPQVELEDFAGVSSDSALGSSFGSEQDANERIVSSSADNFPRTSFGRTPNGRPMSHVERSRGGSVNIGSSKGSLTLPGGRGKRGASVSSPLTARIKERPVSMANFQSGSSSAQKSKLDVKICPASPLVGHTRSKRDEDGNILPCIRMSSEAGMSTGKSVNKVSFNKRVTKWTAMAAQVYDRKCDPRPSLSPNEKMSLYIDLMSFKLTEMLVHESSLQYTNKHLARLDPDSLEIMSKIINEIIARHLQSVNARQQAEQQQQQTLQVKRENSSSGGSTPQQGLRNRQGSQRGLQNRSGSQRARSLQSRSGSQTGNMGLQMPKTGRMMSLSQDGLQTRNSNQNASPTAKGRSGSFYGRSPGAGGPRVNGPQQQIRPVSMTFTPNSQRESQRGVSPRPADKQRQSQKKRPQSQIIINPTPKNLPSQSPNTMHSRKKIEELLSTTPVSNNVVEVATSS